MSGHNPASKRADASVTVFLALSFALIAGLVLGITEISRTAAHRYYMQVALNGGMESLFSQYHRPLWENYRIFGLEYRDEGDLQEELYDFMEPYLKNRDLFPSGLSEDHLDFYGHRHLSEDTVFETEILDYMKYGLVDQLLSFNEAGLNESDLSQSLSDFTKRATDMENLQKIQAEYQLDTRHLVRVENALNHIASLSKSSISLHADGEAALSRQDANAFYRASDVLKAELDKFPAAVSEYSKAADELSIEIAELKQKLEDTRASLGPDSIRIVESELAGYEDYTLRNGQIRQKVEQIPAAVEALHRHIDEICSDVSDFEDWLAEAIAETEDDEDEDGSDYDFSAEIDAFYRSALSEWQSLSLIRYNAETSEINHNNTRTLENLRDRLSENLLSLVLPEGAELPSDAALHDTEIRFTADSEANPVELALIGEYALHYFNGFHIKDKSEGLPPSGAGTLELEYLLGGKASDRENLSLMVTKLIAVREGLNLLYLYSDPGRKAEARAFVSTFLVTAGTPLLIPVFTFFVLGVWALAQAIMDVRTLLSGGRVPLIHNKQSWSINIKDLLSLGENGFSSGSSAGHGLSYRDYLRAFLYGEGLLHQNVINTRMLSRIEKNLDSGKFQPSGSFAIDQCLYAIGAEIGINARHSMYSIGILRFAAGQDLSSRESYAMKLDSFYSYGNDTQ